jgi:hypothetical protein
MSASGGINCRERAHMHNPLSGRMPETSRLDFRLSATQPGLPGASDVQARCAWSPARETSWNKFLPLCYALLMLR